MFKKVWHVRESQPGTLVAQTDLTASSEWCHWNHPNENKWHLSFLCFLVKCCVQGKKVHYKNNFFVQVKTKLNIRLTRIKGARNNELKKQTVLIKVASPYYYPRSVLLIFLLQCWMQSMKNTESWFANNIKLMHNNIARLFTGIKWKHWSAEHLWQLHETACTSIFKFSWKDSLRQLLLTVSAQQHSNSICIMHTLTINWDKIVTDKHIKLAVIFALDFCWFISKTIQNSLSLTSGISKQVSMKYNDQVSTKIYMVTHIKTEFHNPSAKVNNVYRGIVNAWNSGCNFDS